MKQQPNKLLKGLFSLDHNIKVYIPSTTDVKIEIDNTQYIKKALELFSALFGGATEYNAIGAWQSNKLGLVTEKVTIVESYADKKAIERGLETILKFCTDLKTELKQEAISLEYDNKLYFI